MLKKTFFLKKFPHWPKFLMSKNYTLKNFGYKIAKHEIKCSTIKFNNSGILFKLNDCNGAESSYNKTLITLIAHIVSVNKPLRNAIRTRFGVANVKSRA